MALSPEAGDKTGDKGAGWIAQAAPVLGRPELPKK